MKIYKSEDFINEMYLKIDSSRNLFDECVESLCMYVTGFAFIKKKLELETTNSQTNIEEGKVNLFDYYGITYETVNSDKGGKVVVKFDENHSVHLYPITSKEDDENVLKYLDNYQSIDVYVVSFGKTVKVLESLYLYNVLEPNRRANWGSKTMFDERNKLNKKIKEYVSSWGLTKKYNELNEKLEKDSEKRLSDLKVKRELAHQESEKWYERQKRNEKRTQKGVILEFYKDGIPFEPMADYRFYDYMMTNQSLYYAKKKSKGNLNVCELTLSVLMRQLLKEYCAKELRECIDNPKKPSYLDIVDFIKKYRKYIYTPRKLKEDNYTLVDYFRNEAKDIPCQHCGKKNIVNIMVIEAPDKNKYLVGNECVSHLVPIPEDVFEEKWNYPFTQASNMKNKMKKYDKLGFTSYWFITKDKNKEERFVYIATIQDILKDDWFTSPAVEKPSNYKFHKMDFMVADFSEGFMKRLLPTDYVESIYTDVDIKYVMNCIYPQSSYTEFSFGGVEYNLNNDLLRNKVPYENTNTNVGEFKISIVDDDGLPSIEINFRNYTYKIKYPDLSE